MLLSILISFSFFGKFQLIAFSRVAVYVLGMFIAANSNNGKINYRRWMVIISVLSIGILLLALFYINYYEYMGWYGLWWYPFVLIAPTILCVFAAFFDKTRNIKPVFLFSRVLALFGKSSLEILLVSDFVFSIEKDFDYIIVSERVTTLLFLIVFIVIGVIFYSIVEVCKKNSQKENSK